MNVKKLVIMLGLISLSSSVWAISEPVDRSENVDSCYFNDNQYKFNGVHVAFDGSESYVYESDVLFYNHKGNSKPPQEMYKGKFRILDEKGEVYEICFRKNAAPYKLLQVKI